MQIMLEALRAVPKHIPIIADAKRGDIGIPVASYARRSSTSTSSMPAP
jgi:orotidine-5'-phosphate decarboxylase